MPSELAEVEDSMREYAQAGFPGCIGSSDATHVTLEKCWAKIANMHLGGKSSHTTRAFNITVNHRRRILYTTKGHPGRWNDKTLVQFDRLLRGMREGALLEDIDFRYELFLSFLCLFTISHFLAYISTEMEMCKSSFIAALGLWWTTDTCLGRQQFLQLKTPPPSPSFDGRSGLNQCAKM